MKLGQIATFWEINAWGTPPEGARELGDALRARTRPCEPAPRADCLQPAFAWLDEWYRR
jgi:hypothetical protein